MIGARADPKTFTKEDHKEGSMLNYLEKHQKSIFKIAVLLFIEDFDNKIFNGYNPAKLLVGDMISRKEFKYFCTNSRYSSHRGFDKTMEVLRCLGLININKAGKSCLLEITNLGREYAEKILMEEK